MFWPSKEKDVKLKSSVLLPERLANKKLSALHLRRPSGTLQRAVYTQFSVIVE